LGEGILKTLVKKGTKAVNPITNTYLPVMEDSMVSVGDKIMLTGKDGAKEYIFVRRISNDLILVIPRF